MKVTLKYFVFLSFLINAKSPQQIKNTGKFALQDWHPFNLDSAPEPFHFGKTELTRRKLVWAKHLFSLVSIFVLNC